MLRSLEIIVWIIFVFVILSYQNACYDTKTQKIEPGLNFFMTDESFRDCV